MPPDLDRDADVDYLRQRCPTTAPAHITDVVERLHDLIRQHDPRHTPASTFLTAQFEAGLAWVHLPREKGGLGYSQELHSAVTAWLRSAGAPDNNSVRNIIGLGMAVPAIVTHGTDDQARRLLPPLWRGEEIWCQLFSEPKIGRAHV